ncbi:MAG: hypothetical protein AAF654_04005 [Myxococcota bacterium]
MRNAILTVLLFAPSLAFAGPITAAQGKVSSAVAAVRVAGGECKSSALGKLKDARDQLEVARTKKTPEGLTLARRAVEDAMDNATGCPDDATAKMQAAFDSLSALLNSEAAAANAPNPRDKVLAEKRACWNYRNDWSSVDPGCHVTLKGKYAIGKADFTALRGKVSATPDRFAQMKILQKDFDWQSPKLLTAWQLELLLRELQNPVDQLEAVKLLAKKVVDTDNGHRVGKVFRDGRTRNDALEQFKVRRY